MSWFAPSVVWMQVASTLFMVGVIWYVQLVHYPLMAQVGREQFVGYHEQHTRRTGWVVIGPMVVEAVAATLLLWPGVGSVPRELAAVGFVLVVLVWLSTFGVQVPLHRRLTRGFDVEVHLRLVRSNWVRTALWTVRGVVAIAMVAAG